jgi:tetratricopeptide (TPR) repeat protein
VKDPVAAALFLSIDHISRANAFAADCLFLAACVDRKDISIDLLEASSTQAREDAIRMLDKYALVTRRPAESALDVHRLVHQALRKRVQVQGRLQERTKRTIAQLLRVFPDDDHSNRSKWRRLLPHAQYVLSHSLADDNDNERLRLASRCATTLLSDGRYKEAEDLFVEVMETSKRVLTDEHPDTLNSMHNLAFTLQSQSRHEEALALIERCFQLREQVLGEQHHDTQSSLEALSNWRAECELVYSETTS